VKQEKKSLIGLGPSSVEAGGAKRSPPIKSLFETHLNFNSKAVFLEHSFISDFLDEVELFWKKCLAK